MSPRIYTNGAMVQYGGYTIGPSHPRHGKTWTPCSAISGRGWLAFRGSATRLLTGHR